MSVEKCYGRRPVPPKLQARYRSPGKKRHLNGTKGYKLRKRNGVKGLKIAKLKGRTS